MGFLPLLFFSIISIQNGHGATYSFFQKKVIFGWGFSTPLIFDSVPEKRMEQNEIL